MTTVLGVGGSNHDFSATIVHEGTIRVAIEDERVQRIKNADTAWCAHPARDAAAYLPCRDRAERGATRRDLLLRRSRAPERMA